MDTNGINDPNAKGKDFEVIGYIRGKGARFPARLAEQYGDCIAQVIEETGGSLPEDVLTHAADPESPMHDYFEWDDSAAAYMWRMQQARTIVLQIDLKIIRDGREETVRAFESIHVERTRKSVEERRQKCLRATGASRAIQPTVYTVGDDELVSVRVYKTQGTVMSQKVMRDQMIDRAWAELDRVQKRYNQYADDNLAQVFRTIQSMRGRRLA